MPAFLTPRIVIYIIAAMVIIGVAVETKRQYDNSIIAEEKAAAEKRTEKAIDTTKERAEEAELDFNQCFEDSTKKWNSVTSKCEAR